MRRVVLAAGFSLLVASPAFAQGLSTDGLPERPTASVTPGAAQTGAGHRGFTVFANLGVGVQHDAGFGQTQAGLAGPNFGAGWFLTDRLAVLGRFSGATVQYKDFGVNQASGVWAGTIQFWLNRWVSVEAGAGYGRWAESLIGSSSLLVDDHNFGLLFGFQASVFQKGSHHMRVGVEYAPVFTDPSVHNVGIVVGYQYAKSR